MDTDGRIEVKKRLQCTARANLLMVSGILKSTMRKRKVQSCKDGGCQRETGAGKQGNCGQELGKVGKMNVKMKIR